MIDPTLLAAMRNATPDNFNRFKETVYAEKMHYTVDQMLGRVWMRPGFQDIWNRPPNGPADTAPLDMAVEVMFNTGDTAHAHAVVRGWWKRHAIDADQEILDLVVSAAWDQTAEFRALYEAKQAKKAATKKRTKPAKIRKAYQDPEKPYLSDQISTQITAVEHIMGFISRNPETVHTPLSIAKAINRDRAVVRTTLRRLVMTGRLQSTEGVYSVTSV